MNEGGHNTILLAGTKDTPDKMERMGSAWSACWGGPRKQPLTKYPITRKIKKKQDYTKKNQASVAEKD